MARQREPIRVRLRRAEGGTVKPHAMIAAAFAAIFLTIVVGALTDVIPRPGILDPRRRTQMVDEFAGREPRPMPPRPPSTTLQQLLLIGFFLCMVGMAAGSIATRALSLLGFVVTLAWLIVLRIRRDRRAAQFQAEEFDL